MGMTRQQLVRAVLASAAGGSLVWYDSFLYLVAAPMVFASVYFPSVDPATAVLAGIATYGVGIVARPIGAAAFGPLGDRFGRRAALVASLLITGLATVLVGVIPGYHAIGMWGGALLAVSRLLQGIGVGGEWGGAVLLSMEWGSVRRRGLVASWPQLGVPLGLVLAIGALLAAGRLSGAGFLVWGWRLPFLMSIALVALAVYIRLGILETPLFTSLVEERRLERRPLLAAWRESRRKIGLSALVRIGEETSFYVFTTFLILSAGGLLNLSQEFLLVSVALAATLSLVTVPLAGYLSDLVGRKLVYAAGLALSGVGAFPYFGLLGTGAPGLALLAIVLSLAAHDLAFGPQAAFIAESFPGRIRCTGASLGSQLGSVLGAGLAAAVVGFLLHTPGGSTLIPTYLLLCCIVSLASVALMPDRSRPDRPADYDHATAPGSVAQSRVASSGLQSGLLGPQQPTQLLRNGLERPGAASRPAQEERTFQR